MKNIKKWIMGKWIMGGLIIGMVSGVGINTIMNDNVLNTKAVTCDRYNNTSEEYTMDIVYTTDWLRVRNNPSLNSDIVTVLSPNTIVIRISKLNNGWSKVIYDNQTKYMYSEYLSEVDDSDYLADINYSEYYTAEEFQELGIISWGMYRYTWYSELVLSGEGLDIEGRHIDENGFVCDINDYICVASDLLDKGTIVDTPFGKQGKVYDCGCGSDDIIDCYVSW